MNTTSLEHSPNGFVSNSTDETVARSGDEQPPKARHVALYFDLVPTPIRREHIGAWIEPRGGNPRGMRRAAFRAYQESSLPVE